MRRLLVPALLVAALGGCRTHESTRVEDYEDMTRRVVRIARDDSLNVAVEVRLDSPEISVEWLDTPRRRVTARARVASIGAHARAVGTVVAGECDSARRVAGVREEARSAPAPAGGGALRWVLALVVAVTLLSFVRTRFRR